MREILTEKIGIGEHVMIDGVEYVADKADPDGICIGCAFFDATTSCSDFIGCDGIIFKKVMKEPKYRPYKDTEEMVADWKTRFNMIISPNSMPLIWVTNNKALSLITDYAKYAVSVFGTTLSLETLYEEYIYLDGSPCGKEEGI